MLSERALLLAGLVAIVGIVVTWLGLPALELLWRVAVAGVITAALVDGVLAARIRVRAHLVDRAPLPLGRQVPVRIELEFDPPRASALALRPVLSTDLRTPGDLTILQGPGPGPLALTLVIRAVSLGDQGTPRLAVRVLGPLGLAWWRSELSLDSAIMVVADPATRDVRRPFAGSAGARSGGGIGYGMELQQLRPYRPGDPRRRIDWKASARSNGLVTREVAIEHRQEVMLLIDAGSGSGVELDYLSKLGQYVNLASHLIQLAAADDDHIGLIAFAGKPIVTRPPVRAATAGPSLQLELSRLKPQPGEANPLLAMLSLQAIVRHRALVVVMTDLDDPAVTTQLSSALRLIARRHLPLVVSFDSDRIAALETAEPAEWLDPYVALAAQEIRQAQQANARSLARLGCRVLLTRPVSAERDLARAYQAIRAARSL